MPLNVCPQYSCDAFRQPPSLVRATCSAGACTSFTGIDFSLVVSVPEGTLVDEGMTLTIPAFGQYQLVPANACAQSVTPGDCVKIPAPIKAVGSVIVSQGVELACGRPADPPNAQNQAGGASIPAQVFFRPMWPIATASAAGSNTTVTYLDAASVGLPLDPVRALVASGGYPLIPGPSGTLGTGWTTMLGGTVLYRRYVVPQDDAYPAMLGSPLPIADDFAAITGVDREVTAPPPALNTTFSVVRDQSLRGFTVYLLDTATQLRVSSRATLADGGQATVKLVTVNQSPYDHRLALIVQPPDDPSNPLPTLADPVLVDHLGPTERYPTLPSSVEVQGTVRTPDLTPVESDLIIESVAGGILTTVSNDPTQPYLSYATALHTKPDGSYDLRLPPGVYDTFVTPVAGVAAGSTSVPLRVQLPPVGEPAIAAGKDLVAARRGAFVGIARLADGRPLAGALIEAHAASALAGALDPRRWPRTSQVTVDVSGAFAMDVDPGTYDVVVRPVDGTGFPWTTLRSQVVAPGQTVLLGEVDVPAPIAISVVLHDPADNPLINALVRAFALPLGPTSSSGRAPDPLVQLGAWRTDASGRLSMVLAPP